MTDPKINPLFRNPKVNYILIEGKGIGKKVKCCIKCGQPCPELEHTRYKKCDACRLNR
jgi:hypothetical protein